MACDFQLFAGNTNPIQLTLSDPDAGTPLTGASVNVTSLLDVLANAGVSGFTPPLALVETPVASGVYLGFLPNTVGLAALRKYRGIIEAVLPGGTTAVLVQETFAKENVGG